MTSSVSHHRAGMLAHSSLQLQSTEGCRRPGPGLGPGPGPGPAAAERAQTITLPPLCVTAAMRCLC